MSKYKELLADINRFLYDYSIELSLNYEELEANSDIRFMILSESNYDDIKNYYRILKSQFSKYNYEFIKNLAIKKVYFVRNLDIFNHELEYFISFQNYCSNELGFILIDIHDYKKKYEDIYKLFLHHEIFHFIFEKYKNRLNLIEWGNLNKEFNKSERYKYLLDRDFQYESFVEKGFVSNFATQGLLEDLSETFAYIMTSKFKEKLIGRSKKDKILNYKMITIKKFINELGLN